MTLSPSHPPPPSSSLPFPSPPPPPTTTQSPQTILQTPRNPYPMSHPPPTPEEDPNSKDPFDPSSIRPPNYQPSSKPIQFPQPDPPQPPIQMVQSPQILHTSANLLHSSNPLTPHHHHHHSSQFPAAAAAAAATAAAQYAVAAGVDSKPRDQLQTYDLFPDINVPPIGPPSQDHPSHFPLDPTKHHHQSPPNPGIVHQQHQQQQQHHQQQQHQQQNLYDPQATVGRTKPLESMFYASLPVASASGRVSKRPSRIDLQQHTQHHHQQPDNTPSPEGESPSNTPRAGISGQSSLERRKAHRAYTQKSRNKVNSRFEALLDALPTPPPRLNPRSKAEILEYATETVIRLVSQNNKLELHLALSSSPQLESWLTDQTQNARTVREVCQPIMRLFTIGLEWKGAEVWAIDSRAPTNTQSLGQAWIFVPPPSGRGPSREEEAKISELGGFLDSGKGAYYTTTSNEALAVVYRTGKPAWLSCEYKAQVGFEESEFTSERTRLAQSYGISDVLFVPLILYNHVQIVVTFYNMRSRAPTGNPGLQPQIDPKSSIKVATEAIGIIARRFCSLPGVSEFAEQS